MGVSLDINRGRLCELLTRGHCDRPGSFRTIREDVITAPPDPWMWGQASTPHPATAYGLLDEKAYQHVLPEGSQSALKDLYKSPKAAASDPDEAKRRTYLRHSVDLTMKGGTASGVVYPLAVCEIARRAVLRQVGGSSAGAIAAAAAAAAEIGRSRISSPESSAAGSAALGSAQEPADGAGATPRNSAEPSSKPQFAAGFVGLAQVADWLVEGSNESTAEEYRLGQLFRPTQVARPLFRIFAAVMQRKVSRVPLLLFGTLGLKSLLVVAFVLLGAPAFALRGATGGNIVGRYVLAACLLVTMTLLAVGLLVSAVELWRRRERPRAEPEELAEPVLSEPGSRATLAPHRLLVIGLLATGLLVKAVAALQVRLDPIALLASWLLAMITVLAVQILSMVWTVRSARQHRFGLVAGASPPPSAATRRDAAVSRIHRLLDRVAGLPKQTVEPALMDWLNDALNDLAGLPDGEVLRFGHLWEGVGFPRDGGGKDPDGARCIEARQVNLELMASDLVHRVPMRFPLQRRDVRDGDSPTLFVRLSDLTGDAGQLLPPQVVQVICPESGAQAARDIGSGDSIDDLYPFPLPWDLPVLFAVRMSMALPVLFQAVRLYRSVVPSDVREDFGTRLTKGKAVLRYPKTGGPWVQELWMSDGGITSNFPIHFFDSVLPRWPTLGINLGSHPPGSAHQNVWLPSDSDRVEPKAQPIKRDILSFLSAILDTGLTWRDTVQTVMPAFRGRVATVRLRSDEGGSNLYMNREQVAGLALRGALAGVRLSRRFATDAHWDRHRYLRARVGLGNLAELAQSVGRAYEPADYRGLVSDGNDGLRAIQGELNQVPDPNPAREVPELRDDGIPAETTMPWFLPPCRQFWTRAQTMLWRLANAKSDGLKDEELPYPAPLLKQVPPS